MDSEILSFVQKYKAQNYNSIKSKEFSQKNRICGDLIKIKLKKSNNKIIKFVYKSNGCLFTQASALWLSRFFKNIDKTKLKEAINLFLNNEINKSSKTKIYRKLRNKKYTSRKECVNLPLKALIKALNK